MVVDEVPGQIFDGTVVFPDCSAAAGWRIVDEIFDRIRNRTWIPISDTELVDMIVNANMNGTIDDEEKDLLLEMV